MPLTLRSTDSRITDRRLELWSSLTNAWQKKLNLGHWRINLSEQEPAIVNALMEIVITRPRRIATIRISEGAWEMPLEEFERTLIHELVHIPFDDLREEVDFQRDALSPKRYREYKMRHDREVEKAVEHLAHVLYSLSSK